MTDRKGYTPHRYSSKDQMHIWVQQAINGDQKAFTKLFEKFKPIMYWKVKKRFPNENVEFYEDEVLMFLGRIFGSDINKFDRSKAQFDTWITHCFDMHMIGIGRRKKQVSTTPIDDMYKPSDDGVMEYPIPDNGSVTQNLLNANISFRRLTRLLLTHLTKKETKILLDKYWYGYDDREIEARNGLHYKCAWYQTKRALTKARQVLEFEDYVI
tara:strand:- start:525 stop:1160 length:636 start_codon:yes stop_codon:yes gene_type:complete